MSFQGLPKGKSISKKSLPNQPKQDVRSSLLINSLFNIDDENKNQNKQLTFQVLQKVSQTIVSLHSTLVPKTQNIEIYRDLSQQQQKMLKLVQDNNLIHTILAGVLAIDSCIKYIHRQQTYAVSSLMKCVTIALGNYKKLEQQFLLKNQGKISQNFLKFYDSLKLIISQIHKIPASKIKKNQIQKHNQIIAQVKLNNQLNNILNRQQNLLFAFLAQENNSLRIKQKELEKQILQLEKQIQRLAKNSQVTQINSRKKLVSENNLTETGSDSFKNCTQQIQIKQLKEQLAQKNDIIIKMNDQFALQMQKYQKVFKRLEQQNKLLKKYNDLDTAYILQQLQIQVERLRQQKRNDQNIINQIMQKMDRMSWNRIEMGNKYMDMEKYRKQQKFMTDRKYINSFNHNIPYPIQRNHQMRRSRCPSMSPQNKQMSNLGNRHFSPNYQIYQQKPYLNTFQREKIQYRTNRNYSPKFGLGGQQNNYQSIKQRISLSKQRKSKPAHQYDKNKLNEQIHEVKEMRKSHLNFNNIKPSHIADQGLQINKMRNRIKKSSFLNQQLNFLP